MHAVDAWIRYIERFGTTEVTVQRLINHGYSYREIIHLLDHAVTHDEPINTASFFGTPMDQMEY
jgi:hypothetical protein